MGDDLFLSPEITMHEEAGEVIIPGLPTGQQIQDEYDGQVDDDDGAPSMPFANGGIPAEISITKVTGTNRATLSNKPMLKVRSDLGANGGMRHLPGMNGASLPQRPMSTRPPPARPPPLVRGGLPPMPRLRMGGPRPPSQQNNPLMGMMNMMGGQNGGHQHPPLPRLPRHPLRGTGPRGIMGGNMRPPQMNRGGGMPRMPLHPNSLLAHRPRPPPPQFLNNSSVQMTRVPSSSPSSSASSGGPPPMMRVGNGGMRMPNQGSNRPVQVSRTVFVPPPMPHGQQQQQQLQQLTQQQQFQEYQQQQQRQQQRQQQKQLQQNYPRNAQAGLMGVRRNLDHFSNGKNNASILQNQLARAQIQQQQQYLQQQQQDEEEEDDGMIDEEELDDVEPDVDPDTNEVDDVEPEDDDDEEEDEEEEENETIRNLKNSFSHEVSVSITSIKKKQPPPPASPAASDNGIVLPGMPVTAPAPPSPMDDSVEVSLSHATGNGDGESGGFAPKVGGAPNHPGLPHRIKKKKKKKKAFRGGNYNFNGKSVKKRGGGRKVTGSAPQSENGDGMSNLENLEDDMEVEEGEVQSPSMLSYLGIQRKDSGELGDSPESVNGVQKAKKTFAKPDGISR